MDMRDNSHLTPFAHACLLSERASAEHEDGGSDTKTQLIAALRAAGADVSDEWILQYSRIL